jgi:hypothetical protein
MSTSETLKITPLATMPLGLYNAQLLLTQIQAFIYNVIIKNMKSLLHFFAQQLLCEKRHRVLF